MLHHPANIDASFANVLTPHERAHRKHDRTTHHLRRRIGQLIPVR
jgi:hypothetical protein